MAREKSRKGKSRKGTEGKRDVDVRLTPTVQFLHDHITEALCNEVFVGVRTTERQRRWTLFALARFWTSVVLDPPPALTPVLERVRRGDPRGLLPQVEASAAAFFERCKTLDSAFFMALYAHFVDEIAPKAPKQYSKDMAHLLKKFSGVSLVDGSKMERIAHRLKILWDENAVILPGSVLAVYDLFAGFATQLWFDPDAAAAEHTTALLAVDALAPDTLLLADRLYCTLQIFAALAVNQCWGLFRRTKALPVRKVRRLARRKTDRGLAEDWIVEAGSRANAIELRLFVLKANGKTYESLTNVLSPERLSLDDAIALYPKRWNIDIYHAHCIRTSDSLKFPAQGADNLFAGATGAGSNRSSPPVPGDVCTRGGTMPYTTAARLPPRPRRAGWTRHGGQSGIAFRSPAASDCCAC